MNRTVWRRKWVRKNRKLFNLFKTFPLSLFGVKFLDSNSIGEFTTSSIYSFETLLTKSWDCEMNYQRSQNCFSQKLISSLHLILKLFLASLILMEDETTMEKEKFAEMFSNVLNMKRNWKAVKSSKWKSLLNNLKLWRKQVQDLLNVYREDVCEINKWVDSNENSEAQGEQHHLYRLSIQ